MFLRINNLFFALKTVYSEAIAWIISIIVAILVFSVNVLSTNFYLLLKNLNIQLFTYLMIGVTQSMSISSIVLLSTISALTGILASLLIYKIKSIQNISNGFYSVGSGGALLGLLVPSCSACGIGLLSVLGYSSLLAFLPFRGLEIGVLGVGLLVVSIISLSNKIVEGCKIKNLKII
ncbi:hypothetical protein HYV79_04880 [Candidatus Woesearchaeota archaeon]|nr:hypothetical protein [Candidatus Woesearchaeota archaeon]